MSQSTMRAYVETLFSTRLGSSYPAVPCKFLNAPFQQPETMWTALHIIEGTSRQAALGPRGIERHVGILQIDTLVPEKTGAGDLVSFAEWTGILFSRKDVRLSDGAYLRFKVPTVKTFDPNNGQCRACMSIAYWRDEPAPN